MTRTPQHQLGSHPQADWLRFSGRAFVSAGTRLKGLTKGFLRDRFYPGFDHERAQPGGSDPSPCRVVDATGGTIAEPRPTRLPADARARRRAVLRRGSRVDERVGQAVSWMARYALPPTLFDLHAPTRPDLSGRVHDAAAIKRIHRWLSNKCVHARLVFSMLRQLGLAPLAAQVAVRNSRLGIGTACDLVCVDAARQAVVVELKACRSSTLSRSCGPMRAPFQHFDDSPLNQYFLQLCATRDMYRATFPALAVSERAYVLVVSDARCAAYRLPGAFVRPALFAR